MASQPNAAAIEVDRLEIRYGGVVAVHDVSFAVQPGEQLTLLGPSGCGKTTTLRALAGLERPSGGTIRIGGQVMYSGAQGIDIPAEKRGLSMVFQSYAIWPHMTVFDNVAYGLRVRKRPRAEIQAKVREALDLVQMGRYADRRASQLSGGQQQRVALARACAFSPLVVLFDEPLSNLDAKLRADMRIELRELQHRLGVTSVYVTHDLEEALAMSDRIVVMRDGVIAQQGTPADIYDRPRNEFVADFVGSANLVRGRLRPDLARDGLIALETASGQIVYGDPCGRAGGAEPTFSIRTVHVRFTGARPEEAGPEGTVNMWPVRVHRCVFQGDFTQIHVLWGDSELVIRSAAAPMVAAGQEAWITVDPRHCVLLEPSPGVAPLPGLSHTADEAYSLTADEPASH
jgi:ABC-type Fe3+/spermidine/putrescine transport system ATPase subunit